MMSQQEKFYIDILRDYKKNFKNHLDIEDNYRTIFSGIFGIGKTTFLREFFDLEEIKQDYEVIHLFPVNYSIATNEDIFELIKFDIFYQLLSKNIKFDIESIDMDIVAYQFIKENFKDIIFPFLNFIPSVGGSIKEIAEKCIEIKNKLSELESSINTDELKEVEKFLEDFSKKKGTIYENDFYSQLIVTLISKLKERNKKVVLIIDDLDRVDPEHIFRLLNVFSAHTDIKGDSSNYNKFDFDRIVFVCDINNIRSIYQTNFGIYTDFNGYIDKFYSKNIFKFQISEILRQYSEIIRKRIKFYGDNHSGLEITNNNFLFTHNFSFILNHFFEHNCINLRDLNRVLNSNIQLNTYDLTKLGFTGFKNIDFTVIQLYDVFIEFFGKDPNKLLDAVKNIRIPNYKNQYLEYFVSNLLLIIYLPKLQRNYDKFNQTKEVTDFVGNFEVKIIQNTYYRDKSLECVLVQKELDLNELNYFKLLYQAFEYLKENL